MHYDADFIIAGGGLSGLSMAYRMLPYLKARNKTLMILEQRERYVQDKHWCGWAHIKHPFEHLVEKTWSTLITSHQHKKHEHGLKNTQYRIIASKRFYDYVLDVLGKSKQVDLRLGVDITSVSSQQVQTKQQTFSCHQVMDARSHSPHQQHVGKDSLLQTFYGWRIRTAVPTFNPNQAHFMEFCADQAQGLSFLYCLPFSEVEAIVEPTYFQHTNDRYPKSHYYELMTHYLQQTFALDEFDVLEEESGALPMTIEQYHDPAIPSIGSMGGLMRPSTGYGFDAIMMHQERLLKHLAQTDTIPCLRPHRASLLWMDKIFLRVLSRHPDLAAKVFMSLFEHTPIDRIARFMSGSCHRLDPLSVIMGVPKIPFIKALL